MKKSAAFFDIDGTISREGLISEMFKKMIKYELIDNSKWYREVEPAFIQWNKRLGDYDLYLQKMVDIYSETIKFTNPFHISYIAKKVIEQKGERVYTYSRERIKWHKDQGHIVIAISGSPVELVKAIRTVYRNNVYYSDVVTQKYFRAVQNKDIKLPNLTDVEIKVMKKCCSDLSYAGIAEEIGTSLKSVEGVRDSLFKKLNVASRVSVAITAIELGIMQLGQPVADAYKKLRHS